MNRILQQKITYSANVNPVVVETKSEKWGGEEGNRERGNVNEKEGRSTYWGNEGGKEDLKWPKLALRTRWHFQRGEKYWFQDKIWILGSLHVQVCSIGLWRDTPKQNCFFFLKTVFNFYQVASRWISMCALKKSVQCHTLMKERCIFFFFFF